jgi:small-conductance mechanosensitive channel
MYGASLLALALFGFLAWLGIEVGLPLTVGGGTSETRVVDIPVLRTVAELAAASALASLLVQALDLALRSRGLDRLLQFQRMALWLVGVIAGLVVIYQVHFAETLPVRTAVLSIGGASVFVVGLALQSALGNVFAGYGLQASKVFRKGDFVMVGTPGSGGVVGTVWDSTLATTRVLTRDGHMMVVPNGQLLAREFRNLDQPSRRLREHVRVGIAYDVPPAVVKDAALQILRTEPHVLRDPAPAVWLADFGDSSIAYELVFWIPGYSERDDTLDSVRTRLWYALQDAGIEIPFPIRTVRMASADEERARAAATQDRVETADRALRACPLFDERAMAGQERRELARAAGVVSLGRGEPLVRRGEASDAMFVVAEGRCEVVLPSGERIAVEPGGHFGEVALVTGQPRTADVVVASDSATVLRLPRASVAPILTRRPEFGTRIESVARERRDAAVGPDAAGPAPHGTVGFFTALLRLLRPF